MPKEIHYKFLAEHSAAPEAKLSVSQSPYVCEGGGGGGSCPGWKDGW